MSPSARRGRLAAAIRGSLPEAADGTLLALFGAAAIGLAFHAPAASATTYVVDTTGDPGTGLTTSLRQAIFQANGSANNVVEFDPGLNGSTITLQQGEIAINQPMYIAGPGAGQLTISGNDAGRIFDISTASATPIAVTVTGLTLAHGAAGGANIGGAIYTKNVSLTLQDDVLEQNTADQGGALFLSNAIGVPSVMKLTRTSIADNSSDPLIGRGGGLLVNRGASIDIVDSRISANTSSEAGGGSFYDVDVTIDDAQITGNHAESGSSGGLEFFHDSNSGTSNVTINRSTISGNTSTFHGGGVSLVNVFAQLGHDTISANSTGPGGGGGVFVFNSTSPEATQLGVSYSTISGNSASHRGGGIDIAEALSFFASHSLIAYNTVYDPSVGSGGGGIAVEYAKTSAEIDNSTIVGNYAYVQGGGVAIFDAGTGNVTSFNNDTIAGNLTFNYASNGILGAGTPQIYGCIIANNSSHTSNQDIDGTFGESYSLIRNVGSASVTVGPAHNKNGQDPQLGPLAVNGGPTLTMLPALSSPALDAGGTYPAGTDQRGLPRNVNGHVDMGAVERQYPEDVVFRDGFDT